MKTFRAALPVSLAILAASLLAGCLADSDDASKPADGSDSARSVVGRLYTDHVYRYTLEAPKGWILQPNAAPNLVDLIGYKAVNVGATLTVAASRAYLPDSGTLAERVSERYRDGGPEGDSARVSPAELRDGVEVVGVDTWVTYYKGTKDEYRKRNRLLFFERGGVLLEVDLQAIAPKFQYPSDLARIDSSLTFF